MLEYVLGIGHLSEEECEQVSIDVSKRAVNMKKALAILQVELNHLEMIKFQVSQRKAQLTKEKRIETSSL